jgi:uncharacterized protein YbjT (DUF2867 family)
MLSSRGATTDVPIGIEHRARELVIEASGIPWTFLRPGYFMTNTLRWAPAIRRDRRVSVPAADGMIVPIAAEDIAEVACLALSQPGHANRYYELTGAELVSAREQVAILARVLGAPIECVPLSLEDAAAGARSSGLPDKLVDSFVMMWRATAAGAGASRTDVFAQLTGHAPMTFNAWAEKHRTAFE